MDAKATSTMTSPTSTLPILSLSQFSLVIFSVYPTRYKPPEPPPPDPHDLAATATVLCSSCPTIPPRPRLKSSRDRILMTSSSLRRWSIKMHDDPSGDGEAMYYVRYAPVTSTSEELLCLGEVGLVSAPILNINPQHPLAIKTMKQTIYDMTIGEV
ncbi:unnamed protein product [Arabis nemorensis]|uniref:Uncharacterized protein n=1 Tax=Arabis nemorensis TaxID=586526 RepID=A0A565BPI7_9BRAS|nr:unnamed protein product [Arabis nemorensis]